MSLIEMNTRPAIGDYMYWRKNYHQVRYRVILSTILEPEHSKMRTPVYIIRTLFLNPKSFYITEMNLGNQDAIA